MTEPQAAVGNPSSPHAAETNFRPVRRVLQLLWGQVLLAFSIAMLLHASQGNLPWDVLHEGIVTLTGLPFGVVNALSGLVAIALWIPLRQKVGIGTLVNIVIVSSLIDPSLGLLDWLLPHPNLLMGITLALAGIVGNGVASAAYLGVRLGPGPRDGLMTGLARRTGWQVWKVRTGIEVVVVVTGVLLGGTFGWSTIAFALLIGPIVQWMARWLAPHGLTR